MTLERAFESCGRGAVADLRVEQRRVRREQFGLCVCGCPIAWHFDDDNRRLACDDPAVLDARLAHVLGQSLTGGR